MGGNAPKSIPSMQGGGDSSTPAMSSAGGSISNPHWNAANPAMYRGKDYTHESLVPNRDYNPSNDPNMTGKVNWQAKPEFVAREAPPDVMTPNTTGAWWGRPFSQPGETHETVANPNYKTGDTRGIRWGNPETITRPVAWPPGRASANMGSMPNQAMSPMAGFLSQSAPVAMAGAQSSAPGAIAALPKPPGMPPWGDLGPAQSPGIGGAAPGAIAALPKPSGLPPWGDTTPAPSPGIGGAAPGAIAARPKPPWPGGWPNGFR